MQTDTPIHEEDELFLQHVSQFMAALLSNPKTNAGYRMPGSLDAPKRPHQSLAKMAWEAAIEMKFLRSKVQEITNADAEAIRTKGDTQ